MLIDMLLIFVKYVTDFVKYDITAFWRELLKDAFHFSRFFESSKMNLKSKEWGMNSLP